MTLPALLIYCLATWRVANLLVNEDGPFHIFEKLRYFAGIQVDSNGEKYLIPDTLLAGILSCVWCCSVWVATFWIVANLLLPIISIHLAALFAFSAGAILVERHLR